MGRVTDGRAAVAAAMEPVLPGRVHPYPLTAPAPAAPAVYVGTYTAGWIEDRVWGATFDVLLVADGADRAAHAMLDELVDAVYDACAASPDCYPDAANYTPINVDEVTVLPAYTFAVAVDLAAITWCAPAAPAAVPIPTPTLTGA